MSELQITAEPGVPQILTTRTFNAPRELLFRAHTDPELLAQWIGPARLTIEVVSNELRDGGCWRFIHRDEEGHEFGFHGVFHGTPNLDTIVRTFEFEGAPGHVSMETLTMEEQEGVTTLRTNSVFQTVIARDMHLASGMESGMRESMDRLDQVVTLLTATSAD